MAFQAIGSAPKYMCLSTDVKPVTAALIKTWGIEAGAMLVETDTGNKFMFNGAAWVSMPESVKLTGSKAEVESFKDTQISTTVATYTRAVGANLIEVYLEVGEIRVRADGNPCTADTGIPLYEGDAIALDVGTLSVYYVTEAIITVVSR